MIVGTVLWCVSAQAQPPARAPSLPSAVQPAAATAAAPSAPSCPAQPAADPAVDPFAADQLAELDRAPRAKACKATGSKCKFGSDCCSKICKAKYHCK